jgi:YidC/Oxa1 family membrane protein insertase
MISFFYTYLYIPIYNLLVFLVDTVPGGDIGLAVVLATIIVKLILMPLSLRAAHTQRQMKLIEADLKHIREKYKDDREQQAKEMLALYRANNIKPFASIFGVLIQIPIVLTLYFVFNREALLNIDPSLLYSFIPVPETVSPLFLGLFAVAGSSLMLAILAALAQFALAHVSIPVPKPKKGEKPTATEDFGRMMALQARFVLPVIIGTVAFTSGAIALYFITSSLVGLVQEYVVRRMKHPEAQSKKG